MHKKYGIYKRIVKGKTIYYYYVYDETGKRQCYSTGRRTKAAAEDYCLELFRYGSLIPKRRDKTLFSTYVKDFWDYDKSQYIQGIIKRGGSFTRTVADWRKRITENHILPYFGNKTISSITSKDIEKWLLDFDKKKIGNSTANKLLTALNIIFKQAVKDGLIPSNPCENVEPLRENPREKGILTIEEAKKLMNPDTAEMYWDNRVCYIANLLAMTTGLRHGEITALQKQDVFPDHLVITHSYDRTYGLKDTKTHKSREVIIHPLIYKLLCSIAPEEGFIFSLKEGKIPISPKMFGIALRKALIKTGLTEEEIKERNITFHSWRHFANTVMRARNIPDSVVQSITGHTTSQMTEHYSHFKLEHQKAIEDYQGELLTENESLA